MADPVFRNAIRRFNKVGHFGVFNGSRFRNEIVPRIREFHASI